MFLNFFQFFFFQFFNFFIYLYNFLNFRHILGTLFTFLSYLIIFQDCVLCRISDCYDNNTLKLVNYTLFFSLYNTGWACCQVSHMSLVPSLSVSRMRRDKLNGLRNSFTYISNFTALAIVMIIFSTVE